MSMNNLARFDNNGIELIIDTNTGESFASISGYARMANINRTTVQMRLKGVNSNRLKQGETLTSGGLQGCQLISENLICEWLPKDNPEMASKLLKVGVRVFLHNLAGYQVQSTATQPIDPLQAIANKIQSLEEENWINMLIPQITLSEV